MPVQLGDRGQPDFSQPLALLQDCHRRVEHFLQVLHRVATEAKGGPLSDDYRRALVAGLDYFKHAAPRHTDDEEHSLFPRLRDVADEGAAQLLQYVDQLEADHQIAAPLHAQIEQIGRTWLTRNQLSADEHAAFRHMLEQLATMYARHIAIEDEQIFPLAGELLNDEQLRIIGKEMQRRRLPSQPA